MQFGGVALAGFLVGQIVNFFAEPQGIAALDAVAAGALLVTFLALGALLWSSAWVYGDEAKSS